MSPDEQAGVICRSSFYDLPYFSMSMIQYDLMHSATGVLSMFLKAFSRPGHPLYLSETQRKDVSQHAPCLHPACALRSYGP